MAGYGAVVSLQQTIERILESSCISLDPPSAKIIQRICRKLKSFEKILERLDDISPRKSRKKVNALDGQIKEAVWRFEDLLESHLSDQILSQMRESHRVSSFSIDLLLKDVGSSFIQTVKDMKKKYKHELDSMPEVEEDEDVTASMSRSSNLKAKMVGFSGGFEGLKIYLLKKDVKDIKCTLLGMPGSGKTTLAENVFEDPEVRSWFDHRVWITVGRKYELNEIVRRLLVQLEPQLDDIIPQAGDDKKHEHFNGVLRLLYNKKLHKYFRGVKKCLFVLDNVWDTEVIDFFNTLLPPEEHGHIRILITTNQDKVANTGWHHKSLSLTDIMEPLTEKESEDLLRMKVFGEEVEDFPPRLKKAAKKIAKNCKGLPFMIVTVADLLLKANKNDDLEFWNEVAENRNSDLMVAAHNQIAKVLFPVYDCFPQSSKMFYLYMAAFPQDSVIPASKVINILIAEGFLQGQTLESIFCGDLISPTVVTTLKKGTHSSTVKTYCLNSSWCYLFNKESCKDRFLLLLNSGCADALDEYINGQRRLCLHANFVLNFKEVHNSVKCNCASTSRSLLCFGPYHLYSIPLDVGFKLLRVLDALKVRFYTFPIEIVELVLLKYLALTYNGELPISISKLFNLQFLIIHPHVSIKSCGAPSYVPVQIWDMQELKHIEILGRNLPNPEHGASLPKLLTLIGVSIHNCTREVLEGLPNMSKLEIQIELSHSGVDDLNFDYIWELKNLEILKCSGIVNPEVNYGCIAPQKPIAMFPSSLQKLHLSGLGYPWKYTKVIGEMPNLKMLKLRCYAFRGPKWETEVNSFLRLKNLIIEDSDLVQWKISGGSCPKLSTLTMKHCYKLQEFNWLYYGCGGMIVLVDCNPLAVTPTKNGYRRLVVASFDGEELI